MSPEDIHSKLTKRSGIAILEICTLFLAIFILINFGLRIRWTHTVIECLKLMH